MLGIWYSCILSFFSFITHVLLCLTLVYSVTQTTMIFLVIVTQTLQVFCASWCWFATCEEKMDEDEAREE